jgi:hypothetical protein
MGVFFAEARRTYLILARKKSYRTGGVTLRTMLVTVGLAL